MRRTDLEESRRLVLEMISTLQREHAKQLEPFLRRLAEIEYLAPQPKFTIDVSLIDQANLARRLGVDL